MNHARAPLASAESVRRSAAIFSAVALVFAAAASLVTLLWNGAFPAPIGHVGANTVLAEARGWSAVTFAVAVPLGALALVHARRGSMRARLAWIGSLGYLAYTYLELAVSPPFTALYLLYVVVFASSLTALVIAAASVDVETFAAFFARARPRRAAAAFALLSAALLATAWLKIIVGRTVSGSFGWPTDEDAVGHVVHALDLGLWVPLGIATGVLLLRKRPLGDLFAAVFLVMATCMLAALTAMVAWHAVAAGESIVRAAPFAGVCVVALALALAYVDVTRKLLLACGVLSSLVYVAANIACALRWDGYSSFSQTISELSAIGAPSRELWIAMLVPYDVLLVAFGVGVWMSAGEKRGLRVTAALLVAIGAIPYWPPMHVRGSVGSTTDTLHLVFASVVSLLILLAIGFGANALTKSFRVYTVATIGALLVSGASTFLYAPRLAANLPTPGMGLVERVNLGVYLLWIVVLALGLRRRAGTQCLRRARRACLRSRRRARLHA